jgi:hypothetical protein
MCGAIKAAAGCLPRWPMVTPVPMRTGSVSVTCMTVPSCTFVRSPTLIVLMSARYDQTKTGVKPGQSKPFSIQCTRIEP